MSLTVGTQAASATPATDQKGYIDTVLTAAGWTQLSDISAATGGTTAASAVFISPSTTGPDGSGVYTGCIIFIEYDDANNRMRFRVCEKYDSDAAGSPASAVKWACPGYDTGSVVPTANYATDDSFLALYQAQGATQKVSWVNIPVNVTGFEYWIGANSDMLFYNNNCGGYRGSYQNCHFVIAGHLQYLGDLHTTAGDAAVFLSCRVHSATNDDSSWTASAASVPNVMASRLPGIIVSTSCPWANRIAGPWIQAGTTGTSLDPFGVTINVNYFHSGTICWPAYIHGYANEYGASGRGLFAELPGFYVIGGYKGLANPYIGLTPGAEVTIDGVTCTTVGCANAESTNGGANAMYLFVDGSIF